MSNMDQPPRPVPPVGTVLDLLLFPSRFERTAGSQGPLQYTDDLGHATTDMYVYAAKPSRDATKHYSVGVKMQVKETAQQFDPSTRPRESSPVPEEPAAPEPPLVESRPPDGIPPGLEAPVAEEAPPFPSTQPDSAEADDASPAPPFVSRSTRLTDYTQLRAQALAVSRTRGLPGWARTVHEMVMDVASATSSDLMLRLAARPRSLFAKIVRESAGNYTATNRNEPPHPDDPRSPPPRRSSYGLFQILDTNGRSLYARRSLLGAALARQVPVPPDSDPALDAGNVAWGPVLTEVPNGLLYGGILLRTAERWFADWFDADVGIFEDRIVPLDRPQFVEDRNRIAAFFNSVNDTTFGKLDQLIRIYWGASSVVGVDRQIRSGHAATVLTRLNAVPERAAWLLMVLG